MDLWKWDFNNENDYELNDLHPLNHEDPNNYGTRKRSASTNDMSYENSSLTWRLLSFHESVSTSSLTSSSSSSFSSSHSSPNDEKITTSILNTKNQKLKEPKTPYHIHQSNLRNSSSKRFYKKRTSSSSLRYHSNHSKSSPELLSKRLLNWDEKSITTALTKASRDPTLTPLLDALNDLLSMSEKNHENSFKKDDHFVNERDEIDAILANQYSNNKNNNNNSEIKIIDYYTDEDESEEEDDDDNDNYDEDDIQNNYNKQEKDQAEKLENLEQDFDPNHFDRYSETTGINLETLTASFQILKVSPRFTESYIE